MTAQPLAWFWTTRSATLWVGHAGAAYPDSFEIERAPQRPDYEAARELFMRQVVPYAAAVIPPGKISTLCFETVYPPPAA